MLFKKVNKITELLQREGGQVSFTELAEVLSEVLDGVRFTSSAAPARSWATP